MKSTTQFPLVSIVIPAYQAQDTLGGAISSGLTQTYPNVEIVVVNDGSSDGTLDIARSYGDRIHLVDQPNSGPSAARNAGMAAAAGEFIVLLDADDLLLPPFVEIAMKVYQDAGRTRTIVTCNSWLMTAGGVDPKRHTLFAYPSDASGQRMQILQANFVATISLFPKELFTETGGFATDMSYCEDWDLWARAIFRGWNIAFQRRGLSLYRWTAGSLSTQMEKMFAGEEQVLQRLQADPDITLSASEREYLDRRTAVGSPLRLVAQADDHLRAGRFDEARREYGTAAQFLPNDRKLQVKARSMALVPQVAALWQRRLVSIDKETGRDVERRA